jgi:hypothetical protein
MIKKQKILMRQLTDAGHVVAGGEDGVLTDLRPGDREALSAGPDEIESHGQTWLRELVWTRKMGDREIILNDDGLTGQEMGYNHNHEVKR